MDEGMGNNVDKLFEFITNKIVIILICVVGFIVPGVLTLFVFKRDVFLQLNFIMNIILSISITVPPYFVILAGNTIGAMLKNMDYNDKNDFLVDIFGRSLLYNFLCFGSAFLDRFIEQNYNTRPFCINLFILISIISGAMILSGLMSKIYNKLHKKSNTKKHY